MSAPKHRFDGIEGKAPPVSAENDAKWLHEIADKIATDTTWPNRMKVALAMHDVAYRAADEIERLTERCRRMEAFVLKVSWQPYVLVEARYFPLIEQAENLVRELEIEEGTEG